MIDISSILASKEQINLAAKLAKGVLSNSLWETYSSFANTFGGTILLGVDENKETKEFIPRQIPELFASALTKQSPVVSAMPEIERCC